MKRGAVYLDSSALIKLVLEEHETGALQEFLRDRPLRLSSSLARVEVIRAARTINGELVTKHADAVMRSVELIAPDTALLTEAAGLAPLALRTLDAVHLATAVMLMDDIEGMVVYDRRLAGAARAAGLEVFAPA